MEWWGVSQCRGLAGNSSARGCSSGRLHEVGEGQGDVLGMSQWWWRQGSGWCHAGVAAGGVSLGWLGGLCCSEGCYAMQPCPAAGSRGSEWSLGRESCSKHISLLGGPCRAVTLPRGASRRGLGRAHRNHSLPTAFSALPGPSDLYPAAPPNLPSMPIPLCTVCLRQDRAHVLGPSREDRQKGWGASPVPVPRHLWRCHRGRMAQLVPMMGWRMQGSVPPVLQPLSMQMVGRGGWQGAAHPQSQAGLAGEVLEDALVRVVVAVVVVGQDACVVGTLHVPAQRLTGALWGWQSVGGYRPHAPCFPLPQHSLSPGALAWWHPAPCHPRAAPALQPEVTKCRTMPRLALGMTSLLPGGDAALALSLQPLGQPTPTGVPGP